jgi:hypothetical protein
MGPYATPCRADIALIELGGNGIVTGRTSAHDLFNDRPNVGGKPPRIGAGSLLPRFAASRRLGLPRTLPRALAACSAAFVRSEIISRSCSATAARIWIVSLFMCGLSTATNSTPLSIQRCNEGQVAGQTIELGDHQPGLLALAGGDGGGELWPVIVALARLNLGELGNQRPAAAIQVAHDRLALRVEAKTGLALPVRADAEIGDKLAVMR